MSHLLPGSITALQDTTISSVSTGQVLVWSGSAWVNQDPTTATSFNITGEGSNSFSVVDSDTINFSSGGAFTFDTSTADTVSLDFSVSPTTGGTSQQVMIFDDNTDSYSWGAPISIASGSSSYLSYNDATRELSVSNLLITDVTTNGAASITAYVATTPTHQSGDIVILPSATGGAQTWIHNGGSAGTIADYTQIITGASMSSFQFQADSGLPSTVINGATIKVLGGTGLATTQGTAGQIVVDFSAAPTTGGSTKQILQFDDSGDTFSWVDQDTVGEILTFSNGLTRTLDNVELGGTLSADVTIVTGSNDLIIGTDSADNWTFTRTPFAHTAASGLNTADTYLQTTGAGDTTTLGIYDDDFYILSTSRIKIDAVTDFTADVGNSIALTATTTASLQSSGGDVTVGPTGAHTLILTGTQNVPVATKTASYTMLEGDHIIIADGNSAVVTITTPATPTVGDLVYVKAIDVTNAVSVTTPSSHKIDGQDTHTFNIAQESITLIYSETNQWRIL